MAACIQSYVFAVSVVTVFFFNSCSAIKCYDCNSKNNSACAALHLRGMHAIVPVVDCADALPGSLAKQFFCRKITQTILHPEQTPEVRITRGCGWVKHKRACYTADNQDHLETVCQCFGDMCNGASTLMDDKMSLLTAVAAILLAFQTWRRKV